MHTAGGRWNRSTVKNAALLQMDPSCTKPERTEIIDASQDIGHCELIKLLLCVCTHTGGDQQNINSTLPAALTGVGKFKH